MEFETVKEWLDKLVDSYNELKNLKYCSTQIEMCGIMNHIHIYKGIEIIAEAMGIQLEMICDDDIKYKYPYKYYFIYRRYEILQLCEKPLEGVADGTD